MNRLRKLAQLDEIQGDPNEIGLQLKVIGKEAISNRAGVSKAVKKVLLGNQRTTDIIENFLDEVRKELDI